MRVRFAFAVSFALVAVVLLALPALALGATLSPSGTVTTGLVTISISPVSYGSLTFYVDGAAVATKRAGFHVTEVYEDGSYDGFYSSSHQVFLADGNHTLSVKQGGVVIGSSAVLVKAPPQLESVGTDGVNGTLTFTNNGPTMTCNFYDPTVSTLVKSGGPSSVVRDQFGMYHLTFAVSPSKCTAAGSGYACNIYTFGFKANEAFPTGGVSTTLIGSKSFELPTCIHWWDSSPEGVWDHENGIGCTVP